MWEQKGQVNWDQGNLKEKWADNLEVMREGTEQIFKLLRTNLYWRLQQAVWLVVWPGSELTEQAYLSVLPLPTQPFHESRLAAVPVLPLSSQERQKLLRICVPLMFSASHLTVLLTSNAPAILTPCLEQVGELEKEIPRAWEALTHRNPFRRL